MEEVFYFILTLVAIIAAITLFSKMRSDGKKLGNEETERAEALGKYIGEPVMHDPVFERYSFREALDRCWKTLSNGPTIDIVELLRDKINCQLALEGTSTDGQIVLTFSFPQGNPEKYLPSSLIERAEGDGTLLHIRYPASLEKGIIESDLLASFQISENDWVKYFLWIA